MAASPSNAGPSPLGYCHPPRYQKWLERARAAYIPPESIEGARMPDRTAFSSWLCDSIGGLVHQVVAEVDRFRISMSDRVVGVHDYRDNAFLAYCRDYDLWSVDGEGTEVMAVGEGYALANGRTCVVYKTRNLLLPVPKTRAGGRFYMHFDFQAAVADLTHGLSPWGDPFLTRGRKESRSTSGVPAQYGGPPTEYWTASSSFEAEAKRVYLASLTTEFRDLVFAVKRAREGGARLELSYPKKDQTEHWRGVFHNGDPLSYRLVLVLPAVRHQRLFAIGRIQRWWRQVRQRRARQEMLERILAEIYAPGGAAASLAAASFAAGVSRQ